MAQVKVRGDFLKAQHVAVAAREGRIIAPPTRHPQQGRAQHAGVFERKPHPACVRVRGGAPGEGKVGMRGEQQNIF